MRRSAPLKAGSAAVDITPPAGIALTGYVLREGPSIGVHDRLYARAVVFEDGDRRAALVACDLLALDWRFVASARQAIEAATGIPGAHVMIACTHTHSGPATIFLHECGQVDHAWLDMLRQHLVNVVQAACASTREARVAATAGRLDTVAHNRRDPKGPTNPRLGVWCVVDTHGQPIATLLNYWCHPTVLGHTNRRISADYPGAAVARVQAEIGGVVLFLTGAAADVNPLAEVPDAVSPLRAARRAGRQPNRADFARVRRMGQALGDEALRALAGLRPAEARLCVASQTLALPLLPAPTAAQLETMIAQTDAQLAEAQRGGLADRIRVLRAMLGWAHDTRTAVEQGRVARSVAAEVQVLCLGDNALVGLPGEPFTEIGEAIQSRAVAPQVLVCGYANDDIGYIPARADYARGGYEIEDAYKYYGYPAALAPEAGELMVETAVALVARCVGQPPA